MTRRRTTIAGQMIVVLVVAILLAAFQVFSWPGLIALVPFGVTAMLARIGSGPDRPDYRPTLLVGAVGTLLIPFLIAIAINRATWGYCLGRPALDRRIVEADRVETVTRVEMIPAPGGEQTFLGTPVEDVEPYIQVHPSEGDYYVLEGRVLRALKEQKALPARGPAPSMPVERLEAAYRLLEDSGRLEDGEPGYKDARKLGGILVEATDRDGRRLLFAGVRGGQVSNDHYPYYEFLFAEDAAGGGPRLLSFRRFYYDLAGIEGIEWPVFFTYLTYLLFLPTLLAQATVAFVRWRGRRKKARAADATGWTARLKDDPPAAG